MADGGKPKVLILGGIGFIGRNLCAYLVSKQLVSFVRVADKVLPSTAFLSAEHKAIFESPTVEYKQANLTSEASIKKIFTEAAKDASLFPEGGKWDVVFNVAGETKYGQTSEVYEEKVYDLSVKVARAAQASGARKFVEVSTGQVYKEGQTPRKENSSLEPWTIMAKYKLKAEETLKGIAGLPLVVVRPAIVYGPGDIAGISPRIITAAVYKHLDEKMKFLWDKSLKINTVHIRDACKALWIIAQKADAGSVWNLADKGQTDQEKVANILEVVFGIKTGFVGSIKSNLAKLNLKAVTEDVNDKHLKPWSDLCKGANIANTPLTPYIDQELLYNNSLSIDGAAVESLGMAYDHPEITEALIREVVDYYVKIGLFPPLK